MSVLLSDCVSREGGGAARSAFWVLPPPSHLPSLPGQGSYLDGPDSHFPEPEKTKIPRIGMQIMDLLDLLQRPSMSNLFLYPNDDKLEMSQMNLTYIVISVDASNTFGAVTRNVGALCQKGTSTKNK